MVVLGDSASAGHGLTDADEALPRRLARALATGRRVSVRSVAVDGATTASVLDHQVPHVDGDDVVVVGVGANDALRGRSARQVTRDTAAMLRGVFLRAPQARVVLVTCPDLSVAPRLPDPLRAVVGWRCRSVARAQAAVADGYGVATVLLTRDGLVPEMFGRDGFHPGTVGHERLARRVAAEVRKGPTRRV